MEGVRDWSARPGNLRKPPLQSGGFTRWSGAHPAPRPSSTLASTPAAASRCTHSWRAVPQHSS